MSSDDKIRNLFHRLTIPELPASSYLIAKDGRFLECSSRFREMLGLPREGSLDCMITDFHYDRTERRKLLHQVEEAEAQGECFEGDPIRLKVKGRDVFLRESIHTLRDPDTGQVIGYFGCVIDVTTEHHYQRLLDQLPVGVYHVDDSDVIVRVNDPLVQILGYESRDEVENCPVKQFYAYPEEADTLRESVKEKGTIVREVRELVKKNGELFFASISSIAIFGSDGSYQGREGTLIDVTKEERYRRSLNDVPVGFYEVRTENKRDIIRQCNQQFATMFDFESEHEVIGLDIVKLYAKESDYDVFMDEIKREEAEGRPLLRFPLKVKTHKGREFFIEVYSRFLKDHKGNIVGRTGVISDVSKEQQLYEKIRSLQSDIGRVLHSYTHTLMLAGYAHNSAIISMSPDPFEHEGTPSIDDIEMALVNPVACLVASMDRFLNLLGTNWQDRGLSLEHWDEFHRLLVLMQNIRNDIPNAEFHSHIIRRIARTVINLCSIIPKEKLPREPIRSIVQDATDVERISCLGTLRQVGAEIIAMDHQVRALRDWVTAGARPEEIRRVVQFWDMIRQAMTNLDEFAHSKGVEFRPRNEANDACVEVVERDVLRALINLLHNAIKYSWKREKGELPWVSIHAYAKSGQAHVEFENYGVPIPKDEIEKGLIFQLGYRGRLSSDRGRLGTGIGLSDARITAKLHSGDVTVESRPAWRGAPPDDYRVPYLTTVTLMLPLYPKKGG